MLTINVYTAYWTPEDVEFGANDPEKTECETLEFDTADEVIDYLTREGLQSPSSYPITGNETWVWFSSLDPYELPVTGVLEDRTAHRAEGIDDATWTRIVRQSVHSTMA